LLKNKPWNLVLLWSIDGMDCLEEDLRFCGKNAGSLCFIIADAFWPERKLEIIREELNKRIAEAKEKMRLAKEIDEMIKEAKDNG
jgi:hypothetical protein